MMQRPNSLERTFWVKQASESTSANRVDHIGFQININGTRTVNSSVSQTKLVEMSNMPLHMFARTSFREEGSETVIILLPPVFRLSLE